MIVLSSRASIAIVVGAGLFTASCAHEGDRAIHCSIVTGVVMSEVSAKLDAFAASEELTKLNEGVAARNYGDGAGHIVMWLSLDLPEGSARISVVEGSKSVSAEKLAADLVTYGKAAFGSHFEEVACSSVTDH